MVGDQLPLAGLARACQASCLKASTSTSVMRLSNGLIFTNLLQLPLAGAPSHGPLSLIFSLVLVHAVISPPLRRSLASVSSDIHFFVVLSTLYLTFAAL